MCVGVVTLSTPLDICSMCLWYVDSWCNTITRRVDVSTQSEVRLDIAQVGNMNYLKLKVSENAAHHTVTNLRAFSRFPPVFSSLLYGGVSASVVLCSAPGEKMVGRKNGRVKECRI